MKLNSDSTISDSYSKIEFNKRNISKVIHLLLIYSELILVIAGFIVYSMNSVNIQQKYNNNLNNSIYSILHYDTKILITSWILSVICICFELILITIRLLNNDVQNRNIQNNNAQIIEERSKIFNYSRLITNIIFKCLSLLVILRTMRSEKLRFYNYMYLNEIIIVNPAILLNYNIFITFWNDYKINEFRIVYYPIKLFFIAVFTIEFIMSSIYLYKNTTIIIILNTVKQQLLVTITIKYIIYKLILLVLMCIYMASKLFQSLKATDKNMFNIYSTMIIGFIYITVSIVGVINVF